MYEGWFALKVDGEIRRVMHWWWSPSGPQIMDFDHPIFPNLEYEVVQVVIREL